MTDDTRFYNETLKRHLKFGEVIDELISYINAKPEASYEIVVGSDSAGRPNTNFVSTICVRRIGNGGRYFWTRPDKKVYCPNLRERIFKEVMLSIALVQELKGGLKDKLGEEFFWDDKIRVHIDVGENGQTRDFIDAVMGTVRGYGLIPIIKPYSFAASALADKHT